MNLIFNPVKRCGFLLLFFFSFYAGSCAQPQVNSDFYSGLLIRSQQQDNAEAAGHFENALSSSNVYIRQAAAEELASLMFEGMELSAKTKEKIRREASGKWAAAFDAVGSAPDRKKILLFLLGFEQDADSSNEAALFAMREFERQGKFFSESEAAAIDGHFAVLRNRYNEALIFFRAFRQDEEWPVQIPELFLEYPNLINDLGRTFQYTDSGREGLKLFLQWERNFTDAASSRVSGDVDEVRFRLLFFAARIARRIGERTQSIYLFEQARLLTTEAEQSDACIWYVLDSVSGEPSGVFIGRLEQSIPYWHNDSYFDDILERFLQRLALNREWENIIRVFSLIQNGGAAVSKAGYAWIIARAIEEGYVNENGMRLAAEAVNVSEEISAVFMRIAYEAGDTSFYYRCQSASAVEQPFLEFPAEDITSGRSGRGSDPSPALQFLLGFFDNGAAALSYRYITAMEKELTPDELRTVAQALAQADMYYQSMLLVSLYINREGYTPVRQDMELWFPRPYRDLVERYAEENDIAPALLFGLIRTESAFQSGVISRAGAVGLTQLMPETALEMAGRIRRAGGPDYTAGENGLDLTDPAANIHIGAYYLNYLNMRFENIPLSVLAYNGGMNRIRRLRSGNTMPADLFMQTLSLSETRNYGKKVMAAAAVYEELYYRQNR